MYSIVWAAKTCFTVWGMMWGSLNSDVSAVKNTPGRVLIPVFEPYNKKNIIENWVLREMKEN